METQRINEINDEENGFELGTVFTNANRANYHFSLNEHLLMYESLKAFQEVLMHDVGKSKIKTAPELIERLLNWFKHIDFNKFLSTEEVESEKVLQLIEDDFKKGFYLEVDDTDNSIPF